MLDRLLKPRLLLTLCVGLLLITSLGPLSWTRPLTQRPRRLIRTLATPIADPIHALGATIRAPAGSEALDAQTQQLREHYRDLLQYSRQLEHRLGEAREQVAMLSGMRTSAALEGVRRLPARVAGWFNDRAQSSLTINRGQRFDVAPGMVAVDKSSLIGRVTDAGPLTATVQLINVPGSTLVVRTAPPVPGNDPRQGMARLTVGEDGKAFYAKTGVDQPVQVGDLAHLADDAWPDEAQGFIVGKVTAVDPWPDDPLLYRRVTVEPLRPLAYLTRLVVLVPAVDQ